MSQLFPQKFYDGIKQFNNQQFYECHDTLEEVWRDRTSNDRIFIQGIIQIAVACHHLQKDNIDGAVKLFEKGLRKLQGFKPSFDGLDVTTLVDAVENLQTKIQVLKQDLKRGGSSDNHIQANEYPVLTILSCK